MRRLLPLVFVLLTGSALVVEPPLDDGRPRYGPAVNARHGKPSPAIGEVEAVVVARPSADRAVVEVRWRRGPRGTGARLVVVPPEGAWLREGIRVASLSGRGTEGRQRFEVGFHEDGAKDLVVCLEAETSSGPRRVETYARLVTPD